MDARHKTSVDRVFGSPTWLDRVLTVTHDLEQLYRFDRVLLLGNRPGGGTVLFDGPPDKLAEQVASRNLAELDLQRPYDCVHPETPISVLATAPPGGTSAVTSRHSRLRSERLQFRCLFQRETSIMLSRRWSFWRVSLPAVLIPALVVPLTFATAIGISVPIDQLGLGKLGFLSILSVIWMGCSLSLLSIAAERDVFDHERLSFLRLAPYLGAKLMVLSTLACTQVAVYMTALWMIRHGLAIRYGRESGFNLFLPVWVTLVLMATACVAVNLGLLISAAVRGRIQVANFLLPLVMIAQMVFSVLVAGNVVDSVEKGYGTFPPAWSQATDNAQESGKPPSTLPAAWASYATLSRPADILLRSFAYDAPADAITEPYWPWRWRAAGMLALYWAAYLAITAGVLHGQSVLPGRLRNALKRFRQPLQPLTHKSSTAGSDGYSTVRANL